MVHSLLGVEINAVEMVFCLPSDKLARLVYPVHLAKGTKKFQLKQLQSLLGHLVFTCRVIPMGRTFCRHLYWAMKGMAAPHHYAGITRPMHDDLEVWLFFLQYNGRSCWHVAEISNDPFSFPA